jgi:hypothetical protein
MEKDTPGHREHDLSYDDFRRAFGEDFAETININTWQVGENLAELYPKIEEELMSAKRNEAKAQRAIRDTAFPGIKKLNNVPDAGLHDNVDLDLIEKIHRGFLFNGAVTACSGVSAIYESLPISISQIGICLVNYQGQHGSYSHRLFKRDLKFTTDDTFREAMELIEKRRADDRMKLSTLALRGIRTFAERAILLERSSSNWLLGRGSPAPFEIMTGFWASYPEMMNKSIDLMQRMILGHERFVYVQGSSKNPDIWALGNALLPFEYLVIDTLQDRLGAIVERGGMRGEIRRAYEDFAREAGSRIAVGVFRVSQLAPPQIFYCHVDHIETGALIALADSALQLHAGTPMLLDLAENLCRNAFGKSDFIASIDQAYAKAEILTKIGKYGD